MIQTFSYGKLNNFFLCTLPFCAMNRGLNYRDFDALSNFAGTVKYSTAFCLLKNWL